MEYEYSIINMVAMKEKGMIAQEGLLNKAGKEGWELAGIDGELYIFKRKLE
ncbi:MAG: hypothetical protein V3T58_00835 [Candidatus Hydrothermarchaeales archaeon]